MKYIKLLSIILFFTGLGISLHDYAHALWQVGGYREILSLQGGYIGYILMIIGYLLQYLLRNNKNNLNGA